MKGIRLQHFIPFLSYFFIPFSIWGQGTAPSLQTPFNFQSEVNEGGNLVRCLPSSGNCRTFQILYTDIDGDFPMVHHVFLKHWTEPWIIMEMTTNDSLPSNGMLFSTTFNFPESAVSCTNDSALAGWTYYFNFSDSLFAATGENLLNYNIPYLKCETVNNCIDSGSIALPSITYVSSDNIAPTTAKFWSFQATSTWQEFPLVLTGGDLPNGAIYETAIQFNSTGYLDTKWDFHDTKSKALFAGAVKRREVVPILSPHQIWAEGKFLKVDSLPQYQYEWWFNESKMPTQSSPKMNPLEDGRYTAILTDSLNCKLTSEPVYAALDDFGGVGIILEIDIQGVGTPRPNPSNNGRVFIDSDSRILEINFIDQLGRRIPATFTPDIGIVRIECRNLSKGLYFLNIVTETGGETRNVIIGDE